PEPRQRRPDGDDGRDHARRTLAAVFAGRPRPRPDAPAAPLLAAPRSDAGRLRDADAGGEDVAAPSPVDMSRTARRLVVIVLGALAAPGAAHGADAFSLPSAPLPYMVGGQTTVVWQYHPAFRSPYQGPHSLRHEAEDAVSHSYTLYTGIRLQPWLDL